jgi:hypothetical protein
VISPPSTRAVRVVPTPKGRGDVHVMLESARQYGAIGSSSVSSVHTSEAGRPTVTSTTTRLVASARNESSVAAMSKATTGS